MPTQSSQVHDESDNESISDLLSPSDGYFAEGHSHPGDVLVPDPSQRASSLDKEREARQELQSQSSSSATRRPQIDTSGASQSSSRRLPEVQPQAQRSPTIASPTRENATAYSNTINESTPLISSAPPAYSPPEPGSPYHQHMRNGHVAGINETIGRTNPLFRNSRQDMGGETEALIGRDKDQKRWSDRIYAWWEEHSYKVFKYIVLALAILTAIGFIVDLIMELNSESEGRHGRDKFPDGHGIPSYCKMVANGDIDFAWERSSSWKLIHITKQPVSGLHNYHVQTMGRIHLQPAPDNAEEDIKVNLQWYYSANAVGSEMEFSKQDNSLRIVTPGSIQNYNDPVNWKPCLYLNVTVWAKPGLKQESFSIGTTTLSIEIGSNYTAWAKDLTIATAVGSIKSHPDADNEAHWGGRDIKIITDSSSIHGTFPLYDSLWLETSAGSIEADVSLHPGSNGVESDAKLTFKSSAGSIRANTPILEALESDTDNKTIDAVPKRKYYTDVFAHAGSIKLNLVHGVRTYVQNQAGSLTASLTPWLEPWRESDIVVESATGAIDVTVKDSLPYKGQALRKLSSRYQYDTGHLTLRYPAEWEGTIIGDLITGSLNVDWPGLQILKRVRQGLFTHIEAKKGNSDAMIKFSGASGGATLIGKGGSRYPDKSKTGGDDHRRIIDDGDQDEGSWPIFIPPFSIKNGK